MDRFIDLEYSPAAVARNATVNFRMVAYMLGLLIAVEALLLAASTVVAVAYGDGDFLSFLISTGICAAIAGALLFVGRNATKPRRRETCIVVASAWLMFSLIGMLPYLIGGYIPRVADAFFETMSGFTTTGATILDNIEQMPHGVLFWRSLTQWIGGLGIAFFTIALMPGFGIGGKLLFLSEATGVTHANIHPKAGTMSRYLWSVYICLTLGTAVLLWIEGMTLFDAVCHSLTATATGGFSTRQASIAYWHSPVIEYTLIAAMLISSISFSLYFFAFKYRFKHLLRDQETRFFLGSVLVVTLIIAASLVIFNDYGVERAFRSALFQVTSCHTTTGFATDDYLTFPPFTWVLIIYTMFAGGCTGSTAGGIKMMRLLIMWRGFKNQFQQIIRPRSVQSIKINGHIFDSQLISTVFVFFFSFMMFVLVGWIAIMACGLSCMEALSTTISALGNVGPALGQYGPEFSWAAMPDVAKTILAMLMLIGRLEIFGFIIALNPATYRSSWS